MFDRNERTGWTELPASWSTTQSLLWRTETTFVDLFHSNWTNYPDIDFDWITSFAANQSEHEMNGTSLQYHKDYIFRDVVFASLAVLIMAATIFGNTLVIIAVCTERRLRKVGNSFIVSLALSDLLVGMIVSPLSLSYELLQEWRLGTALCDFWVSMDVVCCTASIMNLCAISYDRHNAITRPLVYALKRTPRRAAAMIAVVWLYSIGIAIPPLFGWRETQTLPTTQCHVSEEHGYTIYSTFGAFYLPAIVMATLYLRVYRAAKQRQQQWVQGPGAFSNCVVKKYSFQNGASSRTKASSVSTPKFRSTNNLLENGTLSETSIREFSAFRKNRTKNMDTINPHVGFRLMLSGTSETEVVKSQVRKISNNSMLSCDSADDEALSSRNVPLLQCDGTFNIRTKTQSTYSAISEGGSDTPSASESPSDWTPVARRVAYSDVTAISKWRGSLRHDAWSRKGISNGSFGANKPKDAPAAPAPSPSLPLPPSAQNKQAERRGSALNRIKELIQKRTSLDPLFAGKLQRGLKNLKTAKQKNKIYIQQERRAAKTLGIIMSAFVCCWLPFFINALTQPFCKCVPEIIYPIVLWLGYFNSALNPIIYTFFNRDFRRAFSNILHVICCCRKKKRKMKTQRTHRIFLQ